MQELKLDTSFRNHEAFLQLHPNGTSAFIFLSIVADFISWVLVGHKIICRGDKLDCHFPADILRNLQNDCTSKSWSDDSHMTREYTDYVMQLFTMQTCLKGH